MPEVTDDQAIDSFRQYMEEEVWSDARAEWRDNDTYYNRQFPLWDALTKTQQVSRATVHTSRPTDIVNHAVDTLLVWDVHVHRPPAGRGDRHQEDANRLERAVKAAMDDAFLLEATHHPAKQAGKNLILHGYTAHFTGLDLMQVRGKPRQKTGESKEDFEERLETWEFERFGWNPFRLPVPEMGTVLMDPLEKDPPRALHLRAVRAMDLHELTLHKAQTRREAVVFDITGHDAYEPVEVEEWWTAQEHFVKLKGGEVLYRERNPWRFQPFSHTFSGFGQMPVLAEGEKFNPKWLSVGLLAPVKPMLKALDQMVSAEMQSIMRAAYARRGYDGDAAEAAVQLTGDIISGAEGNWWLEEFPELPNTITQFREWLEQAIERGTFSLQTAGFHQAGVNTATQEVILSEASLRKFQGTLENINHLFSIGGSNILKLTSRLSEVYGIETVSIRGETLKVSDIHNNYRIEVAFKQVDPAARERADSRSLEEMQLGIRSPEDYYAAAGNEDGQGMIDRALDWKVLNSPAVAAYVEQQVMKRLGVRQVVRDMERQRHEAMVGPDGQSPLMPAQNGSRNGRPAPDR